MHSEVMLLDCAFNFDDFSSHKTKNLTIQKQLKQHTQVSNKLIKQIIAPFF